MQTGCAPLEGSSVLLLSGGVESATLLYLWKDKSIWPLLWPEGGRCGTESLSAALGISGEVTGRVGEAFRALQAPARLHVPLPHRNLALLSLAASYATQVGCPTLALALNKEDLGSYSSSSEDFLTNFRRLTTSLTPPLSVETPLDHLSKADVIRSGASSGVPYRLSYSCMVGRPLHCGRCSQCKQRRRAFEDAGLSDLDAPYEGG
ncbi:hypothetical protein KFL_000190610 [Klebsormidium nitens]|uniref:7-cyano-7-deazaguanine synthase n=1 Tax=Klebsormidium nitens TaxID=105231 RepID=A0A1Y1HJV8_KLENI|nr:hypothetical protein KFL_000190610 [Klebsormidium nitens]|eukprot:GAQ78844.1 hypothetical protein KFL_000190610 [Klebsormidium nitens]